MTQNAKTQPDWFTNDSCAGWDGRICLGTIPGRVDWRELLANLPCGDGEIPAGFVWNGASSGVLRYGGFLAFPKWKHPIATCRHDWRCAHAQTKQQRKFADQAFYRDVGIGGTKWEQIKGYIGVRIGAWLGIGSQKEQRAQ